MVFSLAFHIYSFPLSWELFKDRLWVCHIPASNSESRWPVHEENEWENWVWIQRFCSATLCGLRPTSQISSIVALSLDLWPYPDPTRGTKVTDVCNPGQLASMPRRKGPSTWFIGGKNCGFAERMELWNIETEGVFSECPPKGPVRCLDIFRQF